MERKILKVIYFDEEAAIDYITISDGGKAISEIINTEQETDTSKLEGETSTGFKIPFLTWFNLQAKIGINSNINNINDGVVKSTLTNTILTDYIKKADTDEKIKKISNYQITPIKDSISYYKMYTPYMLLIKKELNDKISTEVDITKIDEVLKETKGYYEFLATNGKEQIIIRFNISSFKNNYKINNILGMNLLLYGVNVGLAEKEDFSIEKEFEQNESKEITADEILETTSEVPKHKKLKIYDIVLAGVAYEE